MKASSKGDPKVPKDKRFYVFLIVLDKKEEAHFFDNRLNLGQMIDLVCKENLIQNNGQLKLRWEDGMVEMENLGVQLKDLKTNFGLEDGDTLKLYQNV